MTGLASAWSFEHPLDVRLSGVELDQPDYPWWYVRILGWFTMVKLIQQGYGESSKHVRAILTTILEDPDQPPNMVYKIFKDWTLAVKAEG